jgi:hypothetical protein
MTTKVRNFLLVCLGVLMLAASARMIRPAAAETPTVRFVSFWLDQVDRQGYKAEKMFYALSEDGGIYWCTPADMTWRRWGNAGVAGRP